MEKVSISIVMALLGTFMSTWKEVAKDNKITVDEALAIIKQIADKLGLGNKVIISL